MKKRDIASAVIDYTDYPNKGVFHVEETGEKGYVKNVIPGQEVLFRVTKKHGDQVWGNRIEVLKKSPLETRKELCDHFGNCGGCLYQTVPYEKQLELKTEQLQKLLKPILEPDSVFDGILRAPREFGYRNKLDLSFGDEVPGGPLNLGMHKTGTRYTVLDAESCVLAHEDLRTILSAVRDYCRTADLPFYNKLKHLGYLRYLMLRRSETSGEILMVLAVSSQMEHDFTPLVEQLLNLKLEGAITGIHLAICDRYADALLPDELHVLWGKDYFYEELLGLRFKVTLFSFFQTNTKGAEMLYAQVREYLRYGWKEENREDPGKQPVVYDLYCGTGTIAQIVASEARQVYGIELIPEAVEAAKLNAEMNGLWNCGFVAGDVPLLLETLPEKPDFVILDPPREGVHEKALRQINDYGIRHMVYISCKATSFVRDMIYLRREGWQVARYALADLFPGTQHVETVVLLSDKKVGHKFSGGKNIE